MSVESPLAERLTRYQKNIKPFATPVAGSLTRVVGLTLEARGLSAPVGSQCKICLLYTSPSPRDS